MVASDKIAESVIQQMTSQVELFISLSLAICGGLIVIIVQVLLHNRDRSKQDVDLRAFSIWTAAFLCEGASICFGALSRAALTAVTPAIYHIDFSSVENWSDVEFAGQSAVKVAAMVQFVTFFLGILLILFFILANRELLGGVLRAKKS